MNFLRGCCPCFGFLFNIKNGKIDKSDTGGLLDNKLKNAYGTTDGGKINELFQGQTEGKPAINIGKGGAIETGKDAAKTVTPPAGPPANGSAAKADDKAVSNGKDSKSDDKPNASITEQPVPAAGAGGNGAAAGDKAATPAVAPDAPAVTPDAPAPDVPAPDAPAPDAPAPDAPAPDAPAPDAPAPDAKVEDKPTPA